ncbi:MAG: cell division protein FtsA [Cyclobacteriaceae bacterium]
MDSNIIAALDIGTHQTRLLIGNYLNPTHQQVLGLGVSLSQGVNRGRITNIAQASISIRQALEQATEMAEAEIHQVRVGIGGSRMICRKAHGMILRKDGQQEIQEADLQQLHQEIYGHLLPDGWEMVGVIPLGYQIDYEEETMDPVGRLGVRLEGEYLILAVESQMLNHLRRSLEKAGLHAEEWMLTPVSSTEAVINAQEKEAGIAVVDIGSGTTDLAIYSNGRLQYISSLPVAGQDITRDLMEGCQLPEDKAELLKIRFGSAWKDQIPEDEYISVRNFQHRPPHVISRKNVSHIIEARILDILEWVHSELIKSGLDEQLTAGLVLTGGAAQLPGLEAMATIVCQQPTRVGHPNQYATPGARGLSDLSSPGQSGTLGLLRGCSGQDFLPTQFSQKPKTGFRFSKANTRPLHRVSVWWKQAQALLLDESADYVFD